MKYVCQVCGYIYDEAKEGIPFDELPADWRCPLCKAPKSEFVKHEEEKKQDFQVSVDPTDVHLEKLSAGQLAALCTNLARGCEKQYKEKESELFTELATYFTAIAPPAPEASVEQLASLLRGEIASYPWLRGVADEHGDRGAARALVWGEKVVRMLSSLMDRYLAEGEAMLADTEVWVCTACGFVYIGDEPPEQCPVCKVPAWKFEKA